MVAIAVRQRPATSRSCLWRRRRPGTSGEARASSPGGEPSDRTTNRCHRPSSPSWPSGRPSSSSTPRNRPRILRSRVGVAPRPPGPTAGHELNDARHPSPTPHRGGGRVCQLGYRDAGLHNCTRDDGTAHRGGTPRRRAPDRAPAATAPPATSAPLISRPTSLAADDDAADDRADQTRAAHHRTAHHGSPVDEKAPARASQEVSALGPRNERAFDHRSGPKRGRS